MIDLSVRPVGGGEGAGSGYFLVIFDEVDPAAVASGGVQVAAQLEEELEHTREQLRLTVEQYETSTEEPKASNEELQAINRGAALDHRRTRDKQRRTAIAQLGA